MFAANLSCARRRRRTPVSCEPRWTVSFSRISSWRNKPSGHSSAMTRGKRSFSLTKSDRDAQARRTVLVVATAAALLGGWSLHRGRLATAGALAAFSALVLVGLVVPV